MSQMPTTPDWLNDCIIEGLQMMLTLRLRNAPAVDTIDNVVDIWLVLFTNKCGWVQARDYARIRQAFLKVASKSSEWPAPVQVFDSIPPLKNIPSLPAKVTCSLPPERTKAIMAQMQQNLNRWTVAKPKQISPAERHQRVLDAMKGNK